MFGAGERAYVYGKSSEIIGRSFVGHHIASLNPVYRLSELDRLIFGSSARELPERELLPDLERRLLKRSVDSILSVVNSYHKPPELLTRLVRVYEYSDLKTALALIAEGKNPAGVKPSFVNLGRFGKVRFDAWPDLEAMLQGTEFDFLLNQGNDNGLSLEIQLDRHYYEKLWKSMGKLKKSDRRTAERICAEEISLRNCAWILRLRTYYRMKGEELKSYLISPPGRPELSRDALEAVELPLDSRVEWKRWKRIHFLNGEASPSGEFQRSENWQADPGYFQNAASVYLYKLALHGFRTRPSSIDTCFCFIKLKQFEEDLLTSEAEGIAMGMTSRDVFGILETET